MAGKVPTTVSSASGTSQTSSRVPAVPREQTGDRQTDRIQQNAAQSSAAARALPYGDGLVIVKDVLISSTNPTLVAHKLGRAYVGWELKRIRPIPGATVALPLYCEAASPDASKWLKINNVSVAVAATDFIADVWVW